MPSSEIEEIKEDRERLRREHAAGASGLSVVRGLASCVDRAISAIWQRIEGTESSAVVALGGYGRGELSPASDVDLIVLHPRRQNVSNAAKTLAYDLWDAGLELGYAIQTPNEVLRLSRQRLDSETALLDARLVAGDAAFFDEWMRTALVQTSRKPDKFLRRIRGATEARRSSSGDAGEELEPNLKDGRGGLRDLTTIAWIEKVLGPQRVRVEREELASAADFLHRIRNELHFSTGRRTDVLSMQHQDHIATALLGDRGDVAREDVLMHTLYRKCRAIAFALDGILGEAKAPKTGISRILRTRKKPASSSGSEALLKGLQSDPLRPVPEPWPDEVRGAFLSIITGGHKSNAFQQLEQTGALTKLLPEWEGIYCVPQRNVYHRYAVDVHSLELVATLDRLATGGDELTRSVAADSSSDMEVLLIAGLLHDIGKGGTEDHAIRGEELARSAVKRIGLRREYAEDVVWLVRNHLLLSETATRRDIGDERLVGLVADAVGSERRLRLLYLLTVADGMATGPAGWGPWKATLVSQLFTTINHFLEDKELFGKEAVAKAHERGLELKRELSGYRPEAVDAHLDNMPRAWLLGQPVAALIQQSKMMLEPPPPDDLRLHAVPQSDAGIWEVTIVARDRPGLFSKIAGSLSLHGLNILGAEIYTREDGVALDIFRVEALGDEDRLFEHVIEDARKALRGRLSLDVRLSEKRRDYAGRIPRGKREPPQVVMDDGTSDFYTIVEVHASDRVGLLHTITRALAEMDVDIHLAKIATYAEDVVDVFYVRDLDGQKITDPEHVREIERTILHRLEAED